VREAGRKTGIPASSLSLVKSMLFVAQGFFGQRLLPFEKEAS